MSSRVQTHPPRRRNQRAVEVKKARDHADQAPGALAVGGNAPLTRECQQHPVEALWRLSWIPSGSAALGFAALVPARYRAGISLQFGRASAPIIPQPVQIMRGPNAGTSAAWGDSSS